MLCEEWGRTSRLWRTPIACSDTFKLGLDLVHSCWLSVYEYDLGVHGLFFPRFI